ncbi:MAG: DUF2207 domain-containing protein [Candidatus Saccharibacteria bacterium]|nr:DUF2207 domain-containing protein [Candidatus Saccharibacteria bacterium]
MKHNFASKKGLKALSFYCITLMLICQVVLLFGGAKSALAKDVNNFYFKDYAVDFYLEKAEDGTSYMRVKEVFTAEFPTYKQNKGICRKIPYTMKNAQGKPVIIIKGLTRSDVNLTRNGQTEPIYSIDKEDKYYEICTGTDDYVLGEQVYTFEYKYENVITHYEKDGKAWDELYWNTNGTDWQQRFENVTARVHLSDQSIWTGQKWCYVGSYGKHGEGRCEITNIEDGVQFVTKNLYSHENLTFDLEFKSGSFVVPEPEETYVMYFVLAGVILLALFINFRTIKKYVSVGKKREFYKGYFIAPEYAPHNKYGLMEMSANYIGVQRSANTALLLKMIVDGRIELVKGEKNWLTGKIGWKIHPKYLANLETDEKTLLKILNGGPDPSLDKDIELKRRTATSTLVSLGRTLRTYGSTKAKTDGLFEPTKKVKAGNFGGILMLLLVFVFASAPVTMFAVFSILTGTFSDEVVLTPSGKIVVAFAEVVLVSIVIFIVSAIIRGIVNNAIAKYEKRTELGLQMSRYMDGLKLYIKMAEKDRIEFLQSVKGADTSPEGIVKLYEKLLPYAALFGLEKSWMKELQHYAEINEIETPNWYTTNIAAVSSISNFTSIINSVSSISTSSTSYSSSGSSGGGGGGFSGGGGGGGGGGGR